MAKYELTKNGKTYEVDAPTAEEALAALPAQPELEGGGGLGAGVMAAGESFLDNLLISPKFMQLLKMPDVKATDLFGFVDQTKQNAAAFASGNLQDMFTTPTKLKDSITKQERQSAERREQHPVATQAGELFGDAATIALGRIPVKAVAEKAIPIIKSKLVKIIPQSIKDFTVNPGIGRLINRAFSSPKVTTLRNAAGRATEAGVEGAALAILNDQDASELAGYAAGTQLAGTAALGANSFLFKGGLVSAGMKLTMLAATMGGLLQIAKEAAPGGKNFILESMETGYAKVAFGLATAALAGIAGLGRLKGEFAEDLPKFADALTAVSRNIVFGYIREVLEEDEKGNPEPALVVEKMQSDPSFLGDAQGMFEKAFENGDMALTELITQAKEKYPEFRDKLAEGTNKGLGAVQDLFKSARIIP